MLKAVCVHTSPKGYLIENSSCWGMLLELTPSALVTLPWCFRSRGCVWDGVACDTMLFPTTLAAKALLPAPFPVVHLHCAKAMTWDASLVHGTLYIFINKTIREGKAWNFSVFPVRYQAPSALCPWLAGQLMEPRCYLCTSPHFSVLYCVLALSVLWGFYLYNSFLARLQCVCFSKW